MTTPNFIDSRHLAEIIGKEHKAVLGMLTTNENVRIPPRIYVPSDRMLSEKSRFTAVMHPYAELTFTEAKVLAVYLLTHANTTENFRLAESALTYIESVQDGDFAEASEA